MPLIDLDEDECKLLHGLLNSPNVGFSLTEARQFDRIDQKLAGHAHAPTMAELNMLRTESRERDEAEAVLGRSAGTQAVRDAIALQTMNGYNAASGFAMADRYHGPHSRG